MSHAASEQVHTDHPGWKFYTVIAAILGAITGVEILIFYLDAMAPILAPVLLILSAAKFVMVVGFFMHLYFDPKVFTALFMAGMSLAIFAVGALIVLFHYVTGMPQLGG